jgi:ubiquinone/menaquinone biosynthesis C-methylase UbiE
MYKKSNKSDSVEKNIKGLWNHEPYVKKYKDAKYTNKNPELDHMFNRLKTVNSLLKKNLNKNSNILELGFGAGQSSSLFLKEGFKYTGVDISKSLVSYAKLKNKKFVKTKKASFLVGSMDKKLKFKDNQFDAVIVIGALQYVMNIDKCINEIKRVLKKKSIFILAQTNSFAIMDIISPRKFIKFITRVIFKENFMYSYSTTLRSIILENTKLKNFLKVNGNERWLNTNFFISGENNTWNFKGKRRILAYDRIKNKLKKHKFEFISYDYGGVFFYRKKGVILNSLFFLLNISLNFIYKFRIFNFFLKRIGSSNIFVTRIK